MRSTRKTQFNILHFMEDTIVVNTDRKASVIRPEIYGHFSEHLGHCIYGGFWNGRNYREDVIEAFKKINIPSLRWPGGNFADEYHWQDGIGPYDQRKRMVNSNWGGVVEDNSFGTHEFFGLCDKLGCKPYVNGNVGSGSVREMNEWVEYMTFAGDSPMSRLRARNGHKNIFNLKYFGVGNENWLCGGNMRPEYYADVYRRYQTYVRQYDDNKLYKIACGANANSEDYDWTDTLMRVAANYFDGLSLHYYTYTKNWDYKGKACTFTDAEYYSVLKNAYKMEEYVRRHSEIMDKYDPQKRIGLIVDEWGTWYDVEEGTNPGFLYQQNTVRDALVAGITLNILNNHADRVQMAAIAQAVNVLQSPVLTNENGIVLTPTWHVFHLYKEHQGATLLPTSAAASISGDELSSLPGIIVSASVKNSKYLVTAVNTDLNKDREVSINFAGLSSTLKSAAASCITSGDVHDCNDFTNGGLVTEKTISSSIAQGGRCVKITLPAHSVCALTAE